MVDLQSTTNSSISQVLTPSYILMRKLSNCFASYSTLILEPYRIHNQSHSDQTDYTLVLMPRRPSSTCDVVAGCSWQRSEIGSSGFPAHLRWIADVLKLERNANWIGEIYFPFKLLLYLEKFVRMLLYLCRAEPTSILNVLAIATACQ